MKKFFLALVILLSSKVNSQNSNSIKAFKPVELYHASNLIIVQIAENTFLHISYLQTNDFGNVPCNGMVVRNGNEAIVFDTPTNNQSADDLIQFFKNKLHCTIKAILPTHFHEDCLGGLDAFHKAKIPSYGNFNTIGLANAKNLLAPQNGFKDSITIRLSSSYAIAKFFGQGHTKDNVIGYFPSDNILFGGCLIKELNATKGYLGDAYEDDWSNTVMKIKQEYPNVKLVIPGHGEIGGVDLLDYTIKLFRTK